MGRCFTRTEERQSAISFSSGCLSPAGERASPGGQHRALDLCTPYLCCRSRRLRLPWAGGIRCAHLSRTGAHTLGLNQGALLPHRAMRPAWAPWRGPGPVLMRPSQRSKGCIQESAFPNRCQPHHGAPSWPSHLPEAPLPNPIPSGFKVLVDQCWWTRMFSP